MRLFDKVLQTLKIYKILFLIGLAIDFTSIVSANILEVWFSVNKDGSINILVIISSIKLGLELILILLLAFYILNEISFYLKAFFSM